MRLLPATSLCADVAAIRLIAAWTSRLFASAVSSRAFNSSDPNASHQREGGLASAASNDSARKAAGIGASGRWKSGATEQAIKQVTEQATRSDAAVLF